MCARPGFTSDGFQYRCRHCAPCMLSRQLAWTTRIVLESRMHPHSLFVTLTYDQDHLPEDNSLEPQVVSGFLKRLRARGVVCRFHVAGEYGSRLGRPHYHLTLFGDFSGIDIRAIIEQCWDRGFVQVGILKPGGASYVAKYATKGFTKSGDVALKGRHPEYHEMSLRPGLGASYIDHMALVLTSRAGSALLARFTDIPTSVRIDGFNYPLDRYLQARLRLALGRDRKMPESRKQEIVFEENLLPPGERWSRRKQHEQVAKGRIQRGIEKETLR